MILRTFGTLLLAAGLWAQAPVPATIAQSINRQLDSTAREVIGAAQAMPEAKYDFAPSAGMGNFNGVRTFAQEVKHVAVSNYAYGAAILGEKAPVALGPNENGPESIQGKAAIVKLLQDSFTYARNAVERVTGPGKQLGVAVQIAPHCMDHYGQMVEYLRMNGLTPPASANNPPANPKGRG
ncbi:MAG TPA: DinB family protein [Terriglobales bacterium]|nr:DinB family protein [Terriglobales bacterium]